MRKEAHKFFMIFTVLVVPTGNVKMRAGDSKCRKQYPYDQGKFDAIHKFVQVLYNKLLYFNGIVYDAFNIDHILFKAQFKI